jgi:kinetochore protein Fta7
MARKSGSLNAAKSSGIQRKAQLKAARGKKTSKSRVSNASSSASTTRRHSSQANEATPDEDSVPDLEETQDDIDYSTVPQNRPYVYLKARTRKIPQDKITSEWKSLAAPSQEKIKDILTVARRSVVHNTRNKKRADQGDEAVRALLQSLLHRLPRMPFPPKTKELNFDLDKLLEQSVSVYRLLDVRRSANVSSALWKTK